MGFCPLQKEKLHNVAVCHTTQNGGPQVGIHVAKCVADSWEG